ncbi:hypothetical protein JW859_08180 [bacterium]|nr:hypothetical protein [bacterium]
MDRQQPAGSKRDRYDPRPRVTRSASGDYVVHKPVWTARVSILRARAAGEIASYAWTVLVPVIVILALLSLGGIGFLMSIPWDSGWQILVVVGGALLTLALIVRLLYAGLAAYIRNHARAEYRLALSWLVTSDLAVFMADDACWQPIFASLRERPATKYFSPLPPKTFEDHLQFSAIYALALWKMSLGQVEPPPDLGATAGYYRNATMPHACASLGTLGALMSLAATFLNAPGCLISTLVISPVVISLGTCYITHRARFLAICDYFLDCADPKYVTGWSEHKDQQSFDVKMLRQERD